MTSLRKLTFVLLLVVIGGAAWWLLRPSVPPSTTPVISDDAPRSETLPPATKSFSGPVVVKDTANLTKILHSADITPREDLEILQRLLELYRRSNDGANPVGGLNEEIVDKLRGKNPRNLALLPPNHPSIDFQGRLLDRWGQPYFFHPLSGDTMEIRSAGPDGKLWTEDDVQLPQE